MKNEEFIELISEPQRGSTMLNRLVSVANLRLYGSSSLVGLDEVQQPKFMLFDLFEADACEEALSPQVRFTHRRLSIVGRLRRPHYKLNLYGTCFVKFPFIV